MSTNSFSAASEGTWNPDAKWVRIVCERPGGMVEFEFAVGEPELYVEMILPRIAFDDFCAMHQVAPTHDALAQAPDHTEAHEWDWNLSAARTQHFRHPTAEAAVADVAGPSKASPARAAK